jgi:hypothetical protein
VTLDTQSMPPWDTAAAAGSAYVFKRLRLTLCISLVAQAVQPWFPAPSVLAKAVEAVTSAVRMTTVNTFGCATLVRDGEVAVLHCRRSMPPVPVLCA